MRLRKVVENILLSPLNVKESNNNRSRNIWKIDKEKKQRNYIKKKAESIKSNNSTRINREKFNNVKINNLIATTKNI